MKKFGAVVLMMSIAALFGCSKKETGPGKDWSGKPIKTVTQQVHKVKFSIDIPDGMKLKKKDSDVNIGWQADMDDYFSEPHVDVSYAAIPAKSLADFKKYNFINEKHIIVKEETLKNPEGFFVVYHTKNKGLLWVISLIKKGDKALTCRAGQAKSGGVPNFKATQAWLEKICRSIKFK